MAIANIHHYRATVRVCASRGTRKARRRTASQAIKAGDWILGFLDPHGRPVTTVGKQAG